MVVELKRSEEEEDGEEERRGADAAGGAGRGGGRVEDLSPGPVRWNFDSFDPPGAPKPNDIYVRAL